MLAFLGTVLVSTMGMLLLSTLKTGRNAGLFEARLWDVVPFA